ncbi:hypothetical protein HPB49_024488 [Dermacentor silvarum]|uniref:Uncharacterized protein n=1 Tax=Dermacentor silvarum TaxID=543639 RepID=A0ACB8C602_DERSI|nr:hypothetical protein HPB49_024488 [Dermacentor silvarum]
MKIMVSTATQTKHPSTTQSAVLNQREAACPEAKETLQYKSPHYHCSQQTSDLSVVQRLCQWRWMTLVQVMKTSQQLKKTPRCAIMQRELLQGRSKLLFVENLEIAHHESSEVPTRVEEPLHTERKFIVFESCLRELLTTCKVCGQAVGDISSKVVGTLLIVEGMCDKEHMLQWRSQPLVRGSGAGNILLAAGVLFSGCAVAATLRCLNSIGVQTITERTFYNYQRAYLLPAINELFHRKQAEMASELAGLQVDLAGDGRCDSPGYSAKYMTYSVLSMQNGCILHTEQVQVGESPEVPNSVSMEKQGLAKCLMGVEKLGIRIRSLTTDRHPGVNRYCRVEKPEIKHWSEKKLLAASRTHQVITPWIQSILNHLYWVAAMGQGDGELVISMWRSLLNHVCNKHDGHDGPYKKCLHDSLDDREWLRPASPAFLRLKTIVDNARLLKDIRRLSPEVQTFSLESFHSVLNRFAPKSNAFSVDGMQERTRLAVLHFNENAARHQALTQDGEQRWKIKSSKARRGHFTVTTVKEDPSYGYVDDLMQDVVERCEHSSYKESFLSCEKSPPCYMSLGFERPSKQELIAQRRTRFPVASTLSNSS